MLKRSRKALMSSSPSFLVWWTVFLPSPILPMPKPLTVFTSSTVGWPWCLAAAAQVPDVVVAHLGDHLEGARIAAEEILAHVGAVVDLERLVVAVVGVHHELAQRTFLVARQQWIPAAAPDQLDDVPAGAAELAFELLDDLAVAA